MTTTSKAWDRFFWTLTLLGIVVGGVGLVDRLQHGHLHANYGSYVPWGLWVAGYIYLIGLSAGAFVMSALVYVFRVRSLEPIGPLALLTALVTLVGALSLIWLDLGHLERAWRLALRTNFGSVMGWMAWLYSAYFILLLFEFWFAIRVRLIAHRDDAGWGGRVARLLTMHTRDVDPSRRRRDIRILRVLGSIGIPLAVAFHGSVGAIFGVVGARPYWNSGLTPIIFLVGAMLSGAALLTVVVAAWGPGRGTPEHGRIVRRLGTIVLVTLLFDVLLEWAEYSVGLWSSLPSESESLRLVLFGHYAWVFWVVHLGLGVVVPLLLLLFGRGSKLAVALGCALIAITFISVRLNIVIPALAVPELEGLRHAFTGPGLSFEYFPSRNEWLLLVFSVSMAAFIFLTAKGLLPVVEDGESDLHPTEA